MIHLRILNESMAMSSDLICPLCRKVSDNKRAHIRHTSYCRKKAKRPLRSRKRSCLACIKAKSHCDVATYPRCSRCRQKGVECKFERGQQQESAVATRPEPEFTIEEDGFYSSEASSSSQNEALCTDWNDGSISHRSLEELRDTALVQMDQIIMENPSYSPMSTTWKVPGTFSTHTTKNGLNRWLPQDSISDQWNSVPFTLGPQLSLRPVKAFTPTGLTLGSFSLLGRYMTQTIRTYPYMMLSHTGSTPFIHHECLANKKTYTHNNGPGPLLRCASIVELWRNKTPSNASYFWKILRIEQEHLIQEIPAYENSIAINALQALAVYFLLRVSSTLDEEPDFDVPLIHTMTHLGLRVKGLIKEYCDPASPVRPTFHGWIKAESLRRTIATFFIIELLFDLSPGMINGRCNSVALWSEMLLPCSQQLWEAKSEAEWTQRYDLSGDERPYYGELAQHRYLDGARSSLLDRWMANVDDFGKLVISIASVAEMC